VREGQFGDGAGRGVGRIEYRDSFAGGVINVYIIEADAAAGDYFQFFTLINDLPGDLCGTSDDQHIELADTIRQLVFRDFVFANEVSGFFEQQATIRMNTVVCENFDHK
jgi:hypothetical protein